MMREVEEKRIRTRNTTRVQRKFACLKKMCKPKKWPLRDGGTVEVETPQILRAQDLGTLYQALGKLFIC